MSDRSIQVAIEFIQKGDASGAIRELEKLKNAASASGGKAGEQAGSNFAEKFEAKLKDKLADTAGKLVGITGMGRLVGTLGGVGAAIAVGMNLAERAIGALIAKNKEWQEEIKRTAELYKKLRDAGADEKMIEPVARSVRQLAKETGDLNSATSLATKILQGEYTELRKLGIVLDDNASRSQQVATAFARLASTSRSSFHEIEEAARGAQSEIKGIEDAANAATAAVQRTIAAIERAQGAREKAAGNKTNADVANIEADVAEGKISRADADAKIFALKSAGAQETFSTRAQSGQAKINTLRGAIASEETGMSAGTEELAERERIVALLAQLKRREGVTAGIQSQIDARVESGFGPGKTEAEYRAYLATLSPAQSGDALAALDSLAAQRSQAQGNEQIIRRQLPVGRTNLDAETEGLNKLRPAVVEQQNAAYGRITAHMEEIQKLEEEIEQGRKAMEEELRRLQGEQRGKRAGERNRLQGVYDAWAKNPEGAMPAELNGAQIQNGKVILPEPTAPAIRPATPGSRGFGRETEPLPYGTRQRPVLTPSGMLIEESEPDPGTNDSRGGSRGFRDAPPQRHFDSESGLSSRDLSALNRVEQSNQELTTAIESFADKITQTQQTTISKLKAVRNTADLYI